MTERYRAVGAVRMSEIVARERANDPGGSIRLTDLGGDEYEITVTPSPDKDGVSEAMPTVAGDADPAALAELAGEPGPRTCGPNVRGTGTVTAVRKAWQAWR